MDVRCEKCQTEYELDEARLKPGGVTVKCTNCGHMFKIRKRANTDVGVPTGAVAAATAAAASAAATATGMERPRSTSPKPPVGGAARQDSLFDEAVTTRAGDSEPPTMVDRQWLVRLDNGEQKSCRELATLQQWIVSGVVSRESLISRTGKTWKRIGDIAELTQYFQIADEARAQRHQRAIAPTGKAQPLKATMLGVSGGPAAAGGTILPDDEQSTSHYGPRNRPPTPPPPIPVKAMGSPAPHPQGIPQPTRRPQTTPPPPPPKRVGQPTPPPLVAAGPAPAAGPAKPPQGEGRSTAMWAADPTKPVIPAASSTQPFVGKLAAIPDEPAFAGRVRSTIPDESSFETGKVRLEDEEDVFPRRRGSRMGLVLALGVLLIGGAMAAAVYMFVLRKAGDDKQATKPADAAQVAVADAAVTAPPADAVEAPKQTPADLAKAELSGDNEPRLRTALESLSQGTDEPHTQAMRALVRTAVAQALLDRAGLIAERADADKLRKEQKQLVLDAATDAQRAYKAAPEDPAANLALAAVLRLQGKSAGELKRYIEAVKAPEWTREAALASALVLARDGKLDDAKAAFGAIDQGDGKLETSNDVRARYHLALIALAQNRAADAKPLVDQVLAAQPEHAGARALSAKLDTLVAKTDPLPPEENHGSAKPPTGGNTGGNTGGGVDTSGSYDQLLSRANKLADKNCGQAITLYLKALEQKPNGVEALTGLGYCYMDAKQFSNAYSKFRSALAVSARYEPALRGIAEMYQQQGLREQAIEAYQRLLDAYPNSAAAKKALERLGAGTGGGAGSAAPPPSTPQAPPQPPAAPPASDGSGSG